MDASPEQDRVIEVDLDDATIEQLREFGWVEEHDDGTLWLNEAAHDALARVLEDHRPKPDDPDLSGVGPI